MPWLDLLSYVFGGAFLANAVPHAVSGMSGSPFQSPLAKPPGEGLSSSTVVLWGFINLVAGYVLVCRVGDFDLIPTARGGDSAGDSQERNFLILSETVELEGCDGWGCGDPSGFVGI